MAFASFAVNLSFLCNVAETDMLLLLQLIRTLPTLAYERNIHNFKYYAFPLNIWIPLSGDAPLF